MKLNKWCFSVLAASLTALGLADNHLVFRHNGYDQRGGMGNDNWINMKLPEYRGGGELGSDLNKYIGTGRYMLGQSQNRINTWFYVPAEKAGTWTFIQGFDDYMGVRIDGTWVVVNRTYTEQKQGVMEVSEGWHACEITYGDTYGGFGPNNHSPYDGNYPIAIAIGAAGMVKFNEENLQFGDPTAEWVGDFRPTFGGEAYLYPSIAPGANCRMMVEPAGPNIRLFAAPDLTSGCTFALADSAAVTSGRYLLCEWETGTARMPADLDTLFDGTSVGATSYTVELEGLGSAGGRLWVDFAYTAPFVAFRHLKFPTTIAALTLDGGFQNMPSESYVTATYGYHDVSCLGNGQGAGDQLWAKSFVEHAQNRLDGWFYVTPDQAGSWRFDQGWDDFMAIAVDNSWIIVNETYLVVATATVNLTAGWHSFAVVFGDTVGGYGPNGFSPWPWDYPIGVSINGSDRVKFLAANVNMGNPLVDLVGDFNVTVPGNAQFYEPVVPATGRVVFDPAVTTLHSHQAPQFADGAKFAFPASYAGATKGRYLLASWDVGTSNLTIDHFDAACVNAPNAELIFEDAGEGGRVWMNLDPAETVVTARWTGAVDGDCANPANWTCLNANEEAIEGALPDAGTTVCVSGPVALQIPLGAPFVCGEFVIDGPTDLIADCDWRGLDATKIAGVSKSSSAAYREIASFKVPQGVFFGTGFKPNQASRVVMDVEVAGKMEYWFGAWNYEYNNGAFCVGNDGDTGIYSGYGNQGGSQGAYVDNGRHTIELNRNRVLIDGRGVREFGANDFQLDYELTLFAQNRAGGSYCRSDGQPAFHSCQIYDNDTLVRDFRPACRLADGLMGLLDRVTQRFYVPYGGKPLAVDAESTVRTLDVKGHKFYLSSPNLSDGAALTVTDTTTDPAAAGEIHFDIPADTLVQNTAIFLSGNLKLVKEGEGTLMPLVRNVDYAGGTVVAAGTMQMARGSNDDDGVYSPWNFKDAFGRRDTTISVLPGATLDIQGNYDMYVYKIELAGGTLASLGGRNMYHTEWGSLGNVRLSADSSLVAEGSVSYMRAPLDLNGHTLNYAMDRHYEYFGECTISNGRVNFLRGDTLETTAMFQTRGNVDASTADLDFDVLLEVQNEVKVHDVWFRYAHTWGWSNDDGKFLVNGTFHPCACYFPNVVLQNGSAIDLSDQDAPVSTKSLDDTRTDGAAVSYWISFAEGAKIGVDLGDRKAANGDCLMTWATETLTDEAGQSFEVVHRPPSGVSFKLLNRGGECAVTETGLYYFTGLTLVIR